LISCQNQAQTKQETASTKSEVMAQGDIYSFKVKDIEGKEFDFESLRGKKVMIVNTASKCGLTPQYKELQALYEQFKDSDFVIIGFPANDFMEQEPGSEKEIAAFCERNYGVTFPMMSKVSVKGNEMEPVYQYLTQKSQNGVKDSEVEWNFQKYLINKDGHLEKVISPRVSPTDAEIVEWIQS
jgi:glutathione peroxidase